MKWFYEILYSRFRAPYDIGSRPELVELVESGRVQPCRTIYLGSGTAKNAIFMAQHGFDVTGVDYAAWAIELGRRRAREAGVKIDFIQDDLTSLDHVTGRFDFLVDFGTLDDLTPGDRNLYVQNMLPLARPGSRFFLWCFERPSRWWEKFFMPMQLTPGEVERRFGEWFEIERIAGTMELDLSKFQPGTATYLMRQKEG